jgi:hypothetical protein
MIFVAIERLRTSLAPLRGLVVIDEVQRAPELFPLLRVLVDRGPKSRRFLILGSASGSLLHQTSESLAGRISFLELPPFTHFEVPDADRLWLRGGFPKAYLARGTSAAFGWLRDYVTTYLERDIPALGLRLPAPTLRRFWMMLAHYHGQTWKAAEPARSLGVSEPTARRYLDILTGVFMVRQLQPWHANLKKRQVKAAKIYFRDTGLLHQLLGIRTERELMSHPKSGASWEGYVIEEVLRAVEPDEAYFWATHQGAEIDLLLRKDGRLFGVECKRADAPRLTPSIRIALADLKLQRIAVIYPGKRRYALADKVEAVPLTAVVKGMQGLFPKNK